MNEYILSDDQQAKVDVLQQNNDYNWYAVVTDDGEVDLKHQSSLSSIIECGMPAKDYGIVALIQCGLDD